MKTTTPLKWKQTRDIHEAVGRFGHVYEVKDMRMLGCDHEPEDGYDLRVDGKRVAHAESVTEMKVLAEALNAKAKK